MGSCGEMEVARIILEGDGYDSSAIDDATNEVLKYVTLKHGTTLNYTPRALCEGWAKAK